MHTLVVNVCTGILFGGRQTFHQLRGTITPLMSLTVPLHCSFRSTHRRTVWIGRADSADSCVIIKVSVSRQGATSTVGFMNL